MAEFIYHHAFTGAVAADTDKSVFVAPPTAAEKWKLLAISYIPNVTSATNGSNYCSIRPYWDVGTSTPVAAARDTSATSFTVGVQEPITITATGVNLEITQAEPLHFDITHPGTGVAVDLTIALKFERMV